MSRNSEEGVPALVLLGALVIALGVLAYATAPSKKRSGSLDSKIAVVPSAPSIVPA